MRKYWQNNDKNSNKTETFSKNFGLHTLQIPLFILKITTIPFFSSPLTEKGRISTHVDDSEPLGPSCPINSFIIYEKRQEGNVTYLVTCQSRPRDAVTCKNML